MRYGLQDEEIWLDLQGEEKGSDLQMSCAEFSWSWDDIFTTVNFRSAFMVVELCVVSCIKNLILYIKYHIVSYDMT